MSEACSACGQIGVTLPDGSIFDHNGPDGRECSVVDLVWTEAPDHPPYQAVSGQPVTPDREAMIEAVASAMAAADGMPTPPHPNAQDWFYAPRIVDALLPLLTEALDRARQQGKREGQIEATESMVGMIQTFRDFLMTTQADEVARGGPNRKDEE